MAGLPDTETLRQRVAERVDDATAFQFQRDGACVIRQLLTQDELALLAEGIEENLAARWAPRAIWRRWRIWPAC